MKRIKILGKEFYVLSEQEREDLGQHLTAVDFYMRPINRVDRYIDYFADPRKQLAMDAYRSVVTDRANRHHENLEKCFDILGFKEPLY